MKTAKFKSFLSKLGYSEALLSKEKVSDSFVYNINAFLPSETSQQQVPVGYYNFKIIDDLFIKHLALWNQNNCTSFIAVFDDKTYIIDARQKPNKESPLSQNVIKSFQYGVDTEGYNIDEELKLILKEGIDSSYYFNFVLTYQQRKKANEVDKDLLLNLLALRNDLINENNENIIHLLLLRCLFIKYLEDRGVFTPDHLYKALTEKNPQKLLSIFSKIRKINGDLFVNNEITHDDLKSDYFVKLSKFFGYSDYRTQQGKFFPYQFDKIPIQLISSIYESFLKEKTKKDEGIYYTPTFLVDFILANTLGVKLKETKKVTVLDPACGSASFLVQAFRMLIKADKAENNYNKKKSILQNQVFGIDLDYKALQIAAFSLYLALLEREDPEFIQDKIRKEAPILPSLINHTLIRGNALTDEIKFDIEGTISKKKFDCIIANPPWGSVPKGENPENIKIRQAIGEKPKEGTVAAYKTVSYFQRSQAFLLRAVEWCHRDTITGMVVNNSVMLNEKAKNFRKYYLENFYLEKFYELSSINSILFKKRTIGKINKELIEIGSDEPCCVLIYKNKLSYNNKVKYIRPNLNLYTTNLHLITYGSKDVTEVNQKDLIDEDLLWRIFIYGGWSDYQIIKKRLNQKDNNIAIECRSGFQPQSNMRSTGPPEYRHIIKPSDFEQYFIINPVLEQFDWSQTVRRKPDDSIFRGKRIIFPLTPLKSDQMRIRALFVSQDYIYKHDILCVKIKKNNQYIENYKPYLAIFNSKFMGYLCFHISPQWGMGDEKRNTLRNSDVEALPFPVMETSDQRVRKLSLLVNKIELSNNHEDEIKIIKDEIDELVYDLYNVSDYERAVIEEFFELNKSDEEKIVSQNDLIDYGNHFSKVFQLMLSEKFKLSFLPVVSSNLGAAICFRIVNKKYEVHKNNELNISDILNLVKRKQAKRSYFSYALSEEKVKYYDKQNQRIYIIKSNLLKDWTKRQAIDDANEEIGEIIKSLKDREE